MRIPRRARANAKYAQVEQVKKFVILDHDLSQATGELTPTLKVKRNIVNERGYGGTPNRFDPEAHFCCVCE